MARFSVPANSGGGDVSFDAQGCIEFPNNGEICNTANSSGDGYGYSTISIVPDMNLESDQYLIVDPTAPNHIHIRAGGEQDESNADLFLGGEKNNVRVSDNGREVIISTRAGTVSNNYVNDNLTSSATFITNNDSNIDLGYVVNVDGFDYIVDEIANNSPEEGLLSVAASGAVFTSGDTYNFIYEPSYTNYWQFGSNGYLIGPAMGGLFVSSLLNGEGDLWLGSSTNVVLSSGEGGQFLDDPNVPGNQIATIGDISSTVSGETAFTVNGGTSGTQPTFSGSPLFSGSYVKVGSLIHFQIQVDMDNITSFGTGQYYVDLPFPAKYAYQVREGCVHDASTSRQYPIGGHIFAGESRLNLNFVDSNGRDDAFTHNTPFVLSIDDNFHIAGTYIADDEL